MRAFRSERGAGLRPLRLLTLAGLTICVPAFAFGQQAGPPIPLIPGLGSPAQPREPPSPPAEPAGTISGTPLAAPAPGWSGDVAPQEGTLPHGFWRGTPRGLAEILLARLPDTDSPALQALERRLLLSPGSAPRGPDSAGLSLPALRAAALLRLGEIGAARTVIAAIPEARRGPVAAVSVAADAIAGDTDRACATVHRAIQADQTALWQRKLVSCQALQGELREARFGLQLLAEGKTPRDAALGAAVAALSGQSAPSVIAKLDEPDPLLLRLIVKARRRLAPALVEKLSPELALTLALDEEAPPTTQLLAAERAARFGALAPDRLRALYAALPEPRGPYSKVIFAHARGYAAIAKAGSPEERLARIIAFADSFRSSPQGGLAFAAGMVAPALLSVAPDPTLSTMAPAAARFLIAAGKLGAARRWLAVAPGGERRRADELFRLAASEGDPPGDPPAEGARAPKGLVDLALSSALGRRISSSDWAHLPATAWSEAGAPAAPAAARLVLSAASGTKRIGETVLSAILAAGAQGRLSRNPAVLYAVVAALRRVGLPGAAHRLAVEAALDAGL